jgi:hypothetical protein
VFPFDATTLSENARRLSSIPRKRFSDVFPAGRYKFERAVARFEGHNAARVVRMEALRNLPSRGGGFTRVGFGLESHASEAVASPSCHGTDPLDSSHDLPGVVYDSAGNLRTY